MRFASPHALWLLLAVPAAVIAYGVFFGVRRRRLRAARRRGAGRAHDRGRVDARARSLRAALMVAALALTALALARPQFRRASRRPAKQRGLDLVVALDFSRSMLATDIYPSRLERAKRELGELLATLGDDRVGVVAFAGETLTYPPTTDYAAVKLFWLRSRTRGTCRSAAPRSGAPSARRWISWSRCARRAGRTRRAGRRSCCSPTARTTTASRWRRPTRRRSWASRSSPSASARARAS